MLFALRRAVSERFDRISAGLITRITPILTVIFSPYIRIVDFPKILPLRFFVKLPCKNLHFQFLFFYNLKVL